MNKQFTNSPLVSYTKLSPHFNPRNADIDTLTIHVMVGKLTMPTVGNMFSDPNRPVSCNYYIDQHGDVALIVEEKNRSFCTSNRENDHRAVTIEVASEKTHPYAVPQKSFDALLDLCTDICKRNGIQQLLWKADKSLIGQVDKQNLTVHRWFANKECPGKYLYDRHSLIANEVTKRLKPEAEKSSSKEEVFKPYLVTVNVAKLNYRKGPGINYPVNGTVKRNEVFTIVQESKGSGAKSWGKLKSGAGWIALDHTRR